MLVLPYDIHATPRRQNEESNVAVRMTKARFRNEVPIFYGYADQVKKNLPAYPA